MSIPIVDGVVGFFRDGGMLMLVTLLVAVVGAAIVAERLFVLGFRLRVSHKKFLEAIEKLVMTGNYERAIKLCTANAPAVVPRVVRSALANARLGSAAVSASVEEAMSEVLP